jgi:Domain of Unknown Function (DUF928)
MSIKNILSKSKSFPLALALSCVSLTSSFSLVQAQSNTPQASGVRYVFPSPALADRGAPTAGRSRGAGSRGQCPSAMPFLTALVPDTEANSSASIPTNKLVWGLTTQAHPTFWLYIHESLAAPHSTIEFVLQNEQKNEVYRSAFNVSPTQPSLIKFSVPSSVTLEPGKMYRWNFIFHCNGNLSPGNATILVNGWIGRITPNDELSVQLQKSTPQQKAALYAQACIWYDALSLLAQMRRQNPQDISLQKDWVSLLQSIGLQDIAEKPFVESPTSK